jgi:hypothetical protein
MDRHCFPHGNSSSYLPIVVLRASLLVTLIRAKSARKKDLMVVIQASGIAGKRVEFTPLISANRFETPSFRIGKSVKHQGESHEDT